MSFDVRGFEQSASGGAAQASGDRHFHLHRLGWRIRFAEEGLRRKGHKRASFAHGRKSVCFHMFVGQVLFVLRKLSS